MRWSKEVIQAWIKISRGFDGPSVYPYNAGLCRASHKVPYAECVDLEPWRSETGGQPYWCRNSTRLALSHRNSPANRRLRATVAALIVARMLSGETQP